MQLKNVIYFAVISVCFASKVSNSTCDRSGTSCKGGKRTTGKANALRQAVIDNNMKKAKEIIINDCQDPDELAGGVQVLLTAANRNKLEMAKLLIKHGAEVNLRSSPDHFTPLHQAILSGVATLKLFEYLIGCGANVNDPDRDGQTPLNKIARTAKGRVISLRLVKLLLSNGADPSIKNDENFTPLQTLARYNEDEKYSVDIAKELLKSNGNVRPVTEKGQTLLHLYARNGGDLPLLKFLVEIGENINAATVDGDTPLHVAAKYGKVDAVEEFLELEPDLRATNGKGETAMGVALKFNKWDVAKILKKAGAA